MIRRRIRKSMFLTCFFMVLFTCIACGKDENEGPRKVTQRYFNAVKAGDTEGAFECFTPAIQQQYKAVLSLAGLFGGGDVSGLVNGIFSAADQDAYKTCSFKADEVTFTDNDHEHAVVHVTIEGSGKGIPKETTIRTVKYDGTWYVER